MDDSTGLVGQNYLYKNGVFTIRTKGGYFDASGKFFFDRLLWKNTRGGWREYDQWGRKIAYGDRNDQRIELILEDGKSGRILGVKDATGRQVLWYEYNQDNTVKAVHDHTGRRVEYFYDSNGRLVKVKDVLGNEWTYAYDAGKIVTKTDPLGRSAHIAYNADGEVKSVTNDKGDGTYFEYDYDRVRQEYYASILTSGGVHTERYFDKDGRITKELINGNLNRQITYDGRTRIIKDRAGYETIKKFDEWDNLISIQNPDGTSRTYAYNPGSGDLLEERNERGVITRYEYDERGNRVKMIEAAGTELERVTRYAYDESGNMVGTVLPDNAEIGTAEIGMEYDQYGRMVKYTDAEGYMTEYGYDEFGNKTTKKDARGNVWGYGYDVKGRLVSETDPLEHVIRYEYDAVGNRTAVVNAKGKRTEYKYDLGDRVTEVKDALGGVVAKEYDVDGRLVKVTDQVGNVTRYEYDSEGRRFKVVDPAGNDTSYEYDESVSSECCTCAGGGAQGKPSQIIYPTYRKRIEYDPMGRVIKEVEVLDEATSYEIEYAYDKSGNLIRKIDVEGEVTTNEYDSFNRLTKVIDASNGMTRYGYDERDNLVSVTDAEEHTTSLAYDKIGRKVKETMPMGQAVIYIYDPVGNLTTIVDAKKQMTVYEYDKAGRKTAANYYSDSDHTTPEKSVAFMYDEIGNLSSYNDSVTSAIYKYDDLSRKTNETVNYGAFSLSYAYDYNADGTKKSFTGPDGIINRYTYNKGQISSINIPDVGDISYNNYRWQALTKVSYPGGTVRELDYDPLMRVKDIQTKDALNRIIMNYEYSRDKVGNILSKATEYGNYNYTYDKLYHLLAADNPRATDEVFSYDKAGNRISDSSQPGNWGYNSNNQLTGYDGVSFMYDENGNTIQKNDNGVITKYFYNVENHLEKVEDGVGTVVATYYYDPMGRRSKKDVGGIVTYYLYSDNGLIGEYDVYGSEIKAYHYAPNSTWMTNPVFMKEKGTLYYYLNDHLGTSQMIIDGKGTVVWTSMYKTFGRVEISEDPDSDGVILQNNLRLPGQYFDQETDLYYNYFRYYDPVIGRYLTPDPLGIQGTETNLFIYAKNNTNNFFDYNGLTYTYAECGLIQGGEIKGGAVLDCSVETGCCNGYKEKGTYTAVLGGFTVGFPISVTVFTMYWESPAVLGSCPSLDHFNGRASIILCSIAVVGGGSWSEIRLGKYYSYGISFQLGIDASCDAMLGWGHAYGKKAEKCCD